MKSRHSRSFARSLGTRSNLQAKGIQACSDQALAFAISSGSQKDSIKKKVEENLSSARCIRRQGLEESESAALSGSLLLSFAGRGTEYDGSRRSFVSVQSRDSLDASISDGQSQSDLADSDDLEYIQHDAPTMKHANHDSQHVLPAEQGHRSDDTRQRAAFQAHQTAVQAILQGPLAPEDPLKTNGSQAIDRNFLLPEPASPDKEGRVPRHEQERAHEINAERFNTTASAAAQRPAVHSNRHFPQSLADSHVPTIQQCNRLTTETDNQSMRQLFTPARMSESPGSWNNDFGAITDQDDRASMPNWIARDFMITGSHPLTMATPTSNFSNTHTAAQHVLLTAPQTLYPSLHSHKHTPSSQLGTPINTAPSPIVPHLGGSGGIGRYSSGGERGGASSVQQPPPGMQQLLRHHPLPHARDTPHRQNHTHTHSLAAPDLSHDGAGAGALGE